MAEFSDTDTSPAGTFGGDFSDDAAAADKSVTTDYSTAGVGTGTDTYSQQDAMQSALGITSTNPYGYEGFFSKAFGISPENIDYTNIFGDQATMDAIAQKNVDVYSNPNNCLLYTSPSPRDS